MVIPASEEEEDTVTHDIEDGSGNERFSRIENVNPIESHGDVEFATEEFSVTTLSRIGDAAIPSSPKIEPAALQRKLQAMGDMAERELGPIHRRKLAFRSGTGREIFGHRHVAKKNLLSKANDTKKDPLAIAASKLRFGGSDAQNNLRTSKQPRSISALSGVHRGHYLYGLHCESMDESTRCESATFDESVCFSVDSRASTSAHGSPTPTRWERAETSSPRLESVSPSLRAGISTSRFQQKRILSTDQWSEEEHRASSRPSYQAAKMHPDALLKYRRMLLKETNNGLMGGTLFLNNTDLVQEDLHGCVTHTLGQFLPWKGISRRVVSPQLSRS